ncbi:MAG: alpha/beta fold hydrolase [Phycisphaerales bacterium]|nr:alpha/beta fold hydrolase [Phycisphaerales bacterium]MCB9840386.1 alpha/beta fold hydrolase [Phycisphaeraceae bacterium]
MPCCTTRSSAAAISFIAGLTASLLTVFAAASNDRDEKVLPLKTQAPGSGAQPTNRAPALGQPAYFTGSIELPGTELAFHLRLTRGLDGAPSGTIDIPAQNFMGGELRDLVWTGDTLSFVVPIPGAGENVWPHFAFTLSADESGEGPGVDALTGTLRQAGLEFPARLVETDEPPAPPRRPQHPEAPFPYESREVAFENASAGVVLAGTLTLPEGEGPFPCAVMITGSGPQDRDETLMGHKPFLVIADHLTRNGIAVLRWDDRGVGGSTVGDQDDPDSLDFATDVDAALAFLATQDGIDPDRLGLIGHSEGGLIGSVVAADEPRVAFYVMLAGTGVPGDEILMRQGEAIALAEGGDPADVAAQAPMRRAIFEAIAADDEEAARSHLLELVAHSMPPEADPAVVEQMVDAQLGMLTSRWMRTFMALDPREHLRRVRCPVLVLNGDKDTQVLQDQNVPEIVAALHEGGNDDVTVHVLPGLNHLFQPATTGGMSEYAVIETTFDPGTLEIMAAWIREKMGAE